MVDYHTVRNVRTTTPGKVKNEITRREYLLDAGFVLMAASSGPEAPYSLDDLGNALRAPVFTLFLGRKACPPTVPFFGGYAEAPCVERAFAIGRRRQEAFSTGCRGRHGVQRIRPERILSERPVRKQ